MRLGGSAFFFYHWDLIVRCFFWSSLFGITFYYVLVYYDGWLYSIVLYLISKILRDEVFYWWCIFFELFIHCDLYSGWLCILVIPSGILCNCILFNWSHSCDYSTMWIFYVLALVLIKLMYVIQRHGTLKRCNLFMVF